MVLPDGSRRIGEEKSYSGGGKKTTKNKGKTKSTYMRENGGENYLGESLKMDGAMWKKGNPLHKNKWGQ